MVSSIKPTINTNNNYDSLSISAPSPSQSHEITKAFENLAASSSTTPLSSIPEKNYQSLISQLSAEQKTEIEKILEQVTDADIENVLKNDDVGRPDLQSPHIALKAVRAGKISTMQFSTIVSRWMHSNIPPEDRILMPLFDSKDKFITDDALELIAETLGEWGKKSDILKYRIFIELFCIAMKKLPHSEHSFLIIPDHEAVFSTDPQQILLDTLTNKRTISQDIAGNTKINIFSRCTYQGKKMRMIPSFGMMQTYLKTKYLTPVQMNPTLGVVSTDIIAESGKTHTRPVSLPFPGIVLPKEADGLNAENPWDFVYHDFYHSIITSGVPSNYQKAFILVSEIVKELKDKPEFEQHRFLLNAFYERIIDMEFSQFANPGYEDLDTLFWDNLNDTFERTITVSNLTVGKINGIITIEELQQQSQTRMQKLQSSTIEIKQFMDLLSDKIIELKPQLSELGIAFEPIKSISIRIKNRINYHLFSTSQIEFDLAVSICVQLNEKLK